MAFYTADWFKALVREEHAEIQQYLTKKDNDLRRYIDNTLPFTLYLDIDAIRKNVLQPNAPGIVELCNLIKVNDPNIFIKELDLAYQKTINEYIDSFPTIDSSDLSIKLNILKTATEIGGIKLTLQQVFNKTVTIKELSKRNKSVLILSPRFKTIQSEFGSRVKSNFNLEVFSDFIDDNINDVPRNLVKKFLDKNFSVIQNIGHLEIDVISSTSNQVKRGLVTPRLLQALIEWPAHAKPATLARRFSRETGQATTRVIVRKKYDNSRLVLEMLVESGIMIGGLETQASNLTKAEKEKLFPIGRSLSRRIRENSTLLLDLVTSKSINEHIAQTVLSSIKTGKRIPSYSSTTTITQQSKLNVAKINLDLPNKQPTTKVPTVSSQSSNISSLSSLMVLLNQQLERRIIENMGDGNRRDILNYRTGRFASTVKVERLTESRAGAISAFYTYMKNPYATFSTGGKQQYPRTRDPKLLISKSIREIAQTVAVSRMRAVSL